MSDPREELAQLIHNGYTGISWWDASFGEEASARDAADAVLDAGWVKRPIVRVDEIALAVTPNTPHVHYDAAAEVRALLQRHGIEVVDSL